MTLFVPTDNITSISSKFEWEINNFCAECLCEEVNEVFFLSPPFCANNGMESIPWSLKLYVEKKDNALDHLTLYASVSERCKTTKAAVTFAIFNKKGRKMVNYIIEEQLYGETDDESWKAENFVSYDYIVNPSNGILDNDKLTIVCEIVYKQTNRELKELEYNLSQLEVIDRYKAVLGAVRKFSDVSLISEGKVLNVHTEILAKSSSVFAAMFDSKMNEKKDNTVEITNIKFDVLVEMVRFIYADKINNIDTLAEELAVAANEYALDKLKQRCEKTMRKKLNLENVVDYLLLADRIRMAKLKKKAIELIVGNASVVGVTPGFHLLPDDILSEVFCCLAKKEKY